MVGGAKELLAAGLREGLPLLHDHDHHGGGLGQLDPGEMEAMIEGLSPEATAAKLAELEA